ncbi:DNA repair protein RadA [Rhodovibrio sodomensis]|uniref:DNA repair protein RadA n=1 Tax=Rhodovibrio sodomensis TaxID=1088 RepID=A0ABS1DBH0_9PROT|nr:DNA repair protein RadA [Rhodovibrio sodomensis]
MGKTRTRSEYHCSNCGAVEPKWAGQCPSCGEWNTFEERAQAQRGRTQAAAAPAGVVRLDGPSRPVVRLVTGVNEFDRVAGGGLVPGSVMLLGGDPGVGKSTVLLQVLAALDADGIGGLYVSGEESIEQVRLRAQRLGLGASGFSLTASTDASTVAATLESTGAKVAVVDSIQTMTVSHLDTAAGTGTQLRAATQELIRAAKDLGVAMILVGHVIKESAIAGPQMLSHMVDAVLQIERETGQHFRILRAHKNRFGATDEIGVFEMADSGLRSVDNPSELFLMDRRGDVAGSVVYAGMEGQRPILVEVQALVAPSAYATPKRTVVGWDAGRLAMVIAVLEARCGVLMGQNDVYLNVSGGFRITEPAADLAVAAALLSALTDEPLPRDTVLFGEVGLGGELRPVVSADKRLKEARKLGFAAAITPLPRKADERRASGPKSTRPLRNLIELVGDFTSRGAAPDGGPAKSAA